MLKSLIFRSGQDLNGSGWGLEVAGVLVRIDVGAWLAGVGFCYRWCGLSLLYTK